MSYEARRATKERKRDEDRPGLCHMSWLCTECFVRLWTDFSGVLMLRAQRRNGPNTKTAVPRPHGDGNKYVKLGRRVNRVRED